MTLKEVNIAQIQITQELQSQGWKLVGSYRPGLGDRVIMRNPNTNQLLRLNHVRRLKQSQNYHREWDYVFHLVYWENLRQRNRGNFYRIQIEPA